MHQIVSPFGGRTIEYSAEGLEQATKMWKYNVEVARKGKVKDNAKRMLAALRDAKEVVE